MVPQGGNTSLCGASVPDEGGAAVLVCLSRLNRIRAVSYTHLDVYKRQLYYQ